MNFIDELLDRGFEVRLTPRFDSILFRKAVDVLLTKQDFHVARNNVKPGEVVSALKVAYEEWKAAIDKGYKCGG